ncbi:unnamed protein product [Adineta steineri]|uniref:G-protein coupled receptors family 1 profile domain-containing protein n=1 Tax=Adineta steineri TaxID=433720 RepID=A0A814PIR1_9BILA|nr:unnamed protein product [Adineta steineri]CAF1101048.1 unnamed protein product [Adineta steineri]CAF1104964.1 unnamed protein product [Adineta steineri]
MQLISILLSSILILIIAFHRTLRTIPNLLTVNSSLAIFIYALILIAQLIAGLQSINKEKEDMCIFLSYFTAVAADAICYSYLVTAISQYFFNILYRRKYLLTFRTHWIIICISWFISCLLPLLLCFPNILQYSSEMHICSLKLSFQWITFCYMGTAIGIPYFGIIIIYRYIVRHTRRINTMAIATTATQTVSNRDLRVLKNILTLIGILGTAGLPSLILLICNAISPGQAPVPLYLFCTLTISFCTNIQISFIFIMNKKARDIFWNRIRRIFH